MGTKGRMAGLQTWEGENKVAKVAGVHNQQ